MTVLCVTKLAIRAATVVGLAGWNGLKGRLFSLNIDTLKRMADTFKRRVIARENWFLLAHFPSNSRSSQPGLPVKFRQVCAVAR